LSLPPPVHGLEHEACWRKEVRRTGSEPPVQKQPRTRSPMLPAILSLGMALLWWLAVVGLILLADRGNRPDGSLRNIFGWLIFLPIAALMSAAVALGRIKRLPPRPDTGARGGRVLFAQAAARIGIALGALSMFAYAIAEGS
jgi:hypothetical protein